MRSSKTRSRSKSNRNRSTVGNVVNRVFDSSGPESKVRGTPQQIIDKYNQLARDAQLSNDRVAAENFQQHAEHYMRMLSEATREQEQRREQQERENRERQTQRNDSSGGNHNNQNNNNNQSGGQNNSGGQDAGNGGPDQGSNDRGQQNRDQRDNNRQNSRREQPQFERSDDVVDLSDDSTNDSGLVETPENSVAPTPVKEHAAPVSKTNDQGGVTPAPAPAAVEAPVAEAPVAGDQTAPEAEAKPKPKPRRKPRKKPEPKPDSESAATVAPGETPSAAE
ncbi:DUF4167 domain-containing protein [Puniceibacterium sp. IMCC21224]|uniref:DUF4167 domain-containing protein n=1 Tax=Puniceibacterium sp. IMCC21224 TaxID=1618204 RepID=UPI00064DE7D7|nr:DUF4167 domain-containing protein [Puniceibacterium sp. IMCC21224]KMK67028.1 protein of unknown function (DUF4167) [Puniceibacterium sp. IMCC21224]